MTAGHGARRRSVSRFLRLSTAAVIVPALVAGCGMPRDPSGTTNRIERSNSIRLGVVSGAEINEDAAQTLERLGSETGARIRVEADEAEILLGRLEHGELDLVYGNFAEASPWSRRVNLGTAQGWLAEPPQYEPVPRFAMMLGENGWIMQVEKAGR